MSIKDEEGWQGSRVVLVPFDGGNVALNFGPGLRACLSLEPDRGLIHSARGIEEAGLVEMARAILKHSGTPEEVVRYGGELPHVDWTKQFDKAWGSLRGVWTCKACGARLDHDGDHEESTDCEGGEL